MTFDIALVFTVFVAMAIFFITGRVRYDLTALVGLIVLVFLDQITPDQAFIGLSSPTLIIMVSTFFVSEAFFDTGIADKIGRYVYKVCNKNERLSILMLMLVSGTISTFISNLATTIIMMPVVTYISRRSGISPSRLFIPVAFAAVFGGSITLIGTSSNVIASDLLVASKLNSFSLFTFAPIGLIIFFIGTIFMVWAAPYLLPLRMLSKPSKDGSITDIYGLKERLFCIKINKESALAGKSLASLQLGSALNIAVVAILRAGQRIDIPDGREVVNVGDELIVRGNLNHFRNLIKLASLKVSQTDLNEIITPDNGWKFVKITVTNRSLWIGKRLDSIRSSRLNLAVAAIKQKDKTTVYDIYRHYIESGDAFYAFIQGDQDKLSSLASEFSVTIDLLEDSSEVQNFLYKIKVKDLAKTLGGELETSSLFALSLVHPLLLIRGDGSSAICTKKINYEPDDLIIVSADVEKLKLVPETSSFTLSETVPNIFHEDDSSGLIEIALAPRSLLVGQDLANVQFREKYGLQVMALWREGKPTRTGFTDLSLKIGDALLLYGPRRQFLALDKSPDFVVLSELDRFPRRADKSINLLSALFLFAAITMLNLVPLHVASLTVAVFLAMTKTISLEQVYRNIDLRLVVLIAALLPMGYAFENSGSAVYATQNLLSASGSHSPYIILLGLVLLSSLISQSLDAGLAVVLLTPIAIQISNIMSISPYVLVMGIALGSSVAFLTPFSTRGNMIIMGAGGYKPKDFLIIGLPLSAIIITVIVLLLPLFAPF